MFFNLNLNLTLYFLTFGLLYVRILFARPTFGFLCPYFFLCINTLRLSPSVKESQAKITRAPILLRLPPMPLPQRGTYLLLYPLLYPFAEGDALYPFVYPLLYLFTFGDLPSETKGHRRYGYVWAFFTPFSTPFFTPFGGTGDHRR
jgi:hypothetical protein